MLRVTSCSGPPPSQQLSKRKQQYANFCQIHQNCAKASPFFAHKTDYAGVCMGRICIVFARQLPPTSTAAEPPAGRHHPWGMGRKAKGTFFVGDTKKYPEGHSTILFLLLRGAPLTARKYMGGRGCGCPHGGDPGRGGSKVTCGAQAHPKF